MPQNTIPFSTEDRSRLLKGIYNQVTRFEYSDPARVHSILDMLLENIDTFTGTPEIWHNLIMVASRVQYPRRQELMRAALLEWPDDVDLLCDDLQFSYGTDYDPARALERWSKLEGMDEKITGPFWRFWVYGAVYLARNGEVQKGLDLLDRGILVVKRDTLMDVFRGYRSVLVDNIPRRTLNGEQELIDLHKDILRILEEKLSLGIRLGIENGYVLALELARLYQEMAGNDFFELSSGQAEVNELQQRVNDKLRRALDMLHLAECLYTADPNHPIQQIYERRINILMPLHEYDEALKLLRSIPPNARRLEEQRIALESMRRFATLKTGGSLEDEGIQEVKEGEGDMPDEELLNRALQILFRNEGELLEGLARANSVIRETIAIVSAKLAQE